MESIRQFNQWPALHGAYCLAFSGGRDSHVLLHFLARARIANPHMQLRAIHINHQLHPSASQWGSHCLDIAQSYGIKTQVVTVNVHEYPGKGIEGAARIARYQALAANCAPSEVLMTAHHADDQAETVLLQLFRGAGTGGLSAMAVLSQQWGVTLYRPMLHCPHQLLVQYAQHYQLDWISDPSNAQLTFDRNFLRHQVLPLCQQRWHNVKTALCRTAQHAADAHAFVYDICKQIVPQYLAAHQQAINWQALQQDHRRHFSLILRHWIVTQTHWVPTTDQLQQLIHQIVSAQQDRTPTWLGDTWQLRRYRQWLFCLPRQLPTRYPLKAKHHPSLVQHVRRGGERLVLLEHQVTKPLKPYWIQWNIPVWDRGRIPLLSNEQGVVCVDGVFCQCHQLDQAFLSDP